METIRATITMSEALHKELTDMSRDEQRSFSKQVIYLVKKGKEKDKIQTVKGE